MPEPPAYEVGGEAPGGGDLRFRYPEFGRDPVEGRSHPLLSIPDKVCRHLEGLQGPQEQLLDGRRDRFYRR